MHTDIDLVAAPATRLVLTVLSEGESYGYAILKRVRELSGGELEWPDGMVYPLFHRLRRLGYLTTEWRTMPDGRRRRYYAITDDGQAALAKWRRRWASAMGAVNSLWRGPGWLLTALGEAWGPRFGRAVRRPADLRREGPAPRWLANRRFGRVLGAGNRLAIVASLHVRVIGS